MDRRHFLASLSSPLLASCDFERGKPVLEGKLLGPDMALGHKLRDNKFAAATQTQRLPIAIIGGGIGGLSAAWRLLKRGITDFKIFELEAEPGGNSRSGASGTIAHPWGAHYLPFPTVESVNVRAILADLGVLLGDPSAIAPRYDERYVVGVPQERLYVDGLWQESVLPKIGASKRDFEQYKRFDELVERYRRLRGADGAKAFALPSALSSKQADIRALDGQTLRDFLLSQGLDSPRLHWYADYGCRDDYGAHAHHISAWAGLHYHASRDALATDADARSVLTWPQGNGWLVQQLSAWIKQRAPDAFAPQSPCVRLETAASYADIDIYNAPQDRLTRYRADQVIWAAPAQVLAHVWANSPAGLREAATQMEVSPWLVANLTLDSLPIDAGPVGLSWDNVLYDSPALGYVVATHQNIAIGPGPTVLTYYWPIDNEPVPAARKRLYDTDWKVWADAIIAELSRPHPGLREQLQHIDIWRWPHAMARPVPGFLTAPIRGLLAGLTRPLSFAHADLTGFSLFEEATYAGVRAADFAK
ncbi:MAG: twin-arginine translocation pathway signal [Betaproteobacteria bacterium]|nr:twin-arginine translocation pathway signal [Betaproteobacteria bacterium]